MAESTHSDLESFVELLVREASERSGCPEFVRDVLRKAGFVVELRYAPRGDGFFALPYWHVAPPPSSTATPE